MVVIMLDPADCHRMNDGSMSLTNAPHVFDPVVEANLSLGHGRWNVGLTLGHDDVVWLRDRLNRWLEEADLARPTPEAPS